MVDDDSRQVAARARAALSTPETGPLVGATPQTAADESAEVVSPGREPTPRIEAAETRPRSTSAAHFPTGGETSHDATDAAATVCDLAYLAERSFDSGPYAAESDLRQAATVDPDNEAIRWLLQLFAQWGHLFTNQPTLGDLAATLASRTRDARVALLNTDGLGALLPACYLATSPGNTPIAARQADRRAE